MTLEIVPGDAGWAQAAPLFEMVWPAEVRATFSWADIVWAHAERRVFVRNEGEALVGHVGLYERRAIWNERPVRIGGIGGVITHPDWRRQGFASAGLRAAVAEMKSLDFALLFCEPHNFAFYRGLGWRRFHGVVYVQQPEGRVRFDAMAAFVFDRRVVPHAGTIDLCGLPW